MRIYTNICIYIHIIYIYIYIEIVCVHIYIYVYILKNICVYIYINTFISFKEGGNDTKKMTDKTIRIYVKSFYLVHSI